MKDVVKYQSNKAWTRKKVPKVREFSMRGFWLLIQLIIVGFIMLWQCMWWFASEHIVARCQTFQENAITRTPEASTVAGPVEYYYTVKGQVYEGDALRNGVSPFQKTLDIRVLKFAPSVSRPIGFGWEWRGFIIFYGFILALSSAMFLTDNETFPRNGYLYFSRQKPFVHMIVRD